MNSSGAKDTDQNMVAAFDGDAGFCRPHVFGANGKTLTPSFITEKWSVTSSVFSPTRLFKETWAPTGEVTSNLNFRFSIFDVDCPNGNDSWIDDHVCGLLPREDWRREIVLCQNQNEMRTTQDAETLLTQKRTNRRQLSIDQESLKCDEQPGAIQRGGELFRRKYSDLNCGWRAGLAAANKDRASWNSVCWRR